jgi:hypothetical protein
MEAEMLPPRTTHSKQRRASDSGCAEQDITLVEEVVSISARLPQLRLAFSDHKHAMHAPVVD